MISAERLRELGEYYYALAVHPGSMGLTERARALNTSTALVELEAARARIASLEQELTALRTQGLSQEDRDALEKLLDLAHDRLDEDDPRWIEVSRLRRLGGQTT